jgi:hypothetical protein
MQSENCFPSLAMNHLKNIIKKLSLTRLEGVSVISR